MKLILATHNRHKIDEIKNAINDPRIEIISLLDFEVKLPPEDGTTFLENSRGKAYAVQKHFKDGWILADDSGLVVDFLGGRPGVYSSRYSGEPVDYDRNNRKLLSELGSVPKEKRTAHFVCSMVLIDPNGKEYDLEGRVTGYITESFKGTKGFGYDPIFFVPEKGKTIAELEMSDKNEISHRGLAAKKALKILVEFLDKNG